jgi:zinc protease
VYAASSRFARLAGGDEACVGAISRDDVVAFHAAHCTPDATSLIVVGDCTLDDATRLVDAHLGDWAGVAPAAPVADVTRRFADRRVHVIDKPEAQQAEIRLAHVAVPRAHPDYFPLVVMNAILGGVFNSRLNLNLRERHGYTYGAHSSFDWRRAASPFEVGAAVQTDKTADAVREALGEIERIREAPVRDEELSLAVSYLDGVFPIRFETTAAVAGGLANVEIFRLPSSYFDDYRAQVRAVTVADVQRVARAHLDPSAMQVIVVAPAAEVVAPLEALGLGPVAVRPPSPPTA